MEIDTPQFRTTDIDEILPEALLIHILSLLPDARDLARCAAVNRFFQSSSTQVRSVRFTCRQANLFPRAGVKTPLFKENVKSLLRQLTEVHDLRLEIEEKIQAERYKDELDKTSLWLSETSFVNSWVPSVAKTLQQLCLVDYGQQAIFKLSPLLPTLSSLCPNLQTLEVRNMYLDCRDCQLMPKMTNVTMRCVKLKEGALKDITKCMPNLESLTLVSVVGLKVVEVQSNTLTVLCLGFGTRVTSVKVESSSIVKLHLKMACPEKLKVVSPNLKSLALCMSQTRNLQFEGVSQLNELLMGASEFSTLTRLSKTNGALGKVFLDIPCMTFDEAGKWKGVLPQVPLNVPDMDVIRACCKKLETISVGPGLWHSFEQSLTKRDSNGDLILPNWPAVKRFILHAVVQDVDTTLALLRSLLSAVPSLKSLEVYVHESSRVGIEELFENLNPLCRHLNLKSDKWKKGFKGSVFF